MKYKSETNLSDFLYISSEEEYVEISKLIINTLSLTEADNDILQALIVVSSMDDVAMFIHEIVNESDKVDEIYEQNENALNKVLSYVSKKLRLPVYKISEVDDNALPYNCIIVTKIEIDGDLIILSIF